MLTNFKDFQANAKDYLQVLKSGQEIILLSDGEQIARVSPIQAPLAKSLHGILKTDYTEEDARAERASKHENLD